MSASSPDNNDQIPVVFYSAKSGNTRRFVQRLGFPMLEISSSNVVAARDQNAQQPDQENLLLLEQPYILIVPTYNGQVPSPVVRFLNQQQNRSWLRGVVANGSSNFGSDFGLAGKKISSKCNVPLLHTFELTGLPEDIYQLQTQLQAIKEENLSGTSPS